jgi:hypothetical protein
VRQQTEEDYRRPAGLKSIATTALQIVDVPLTLVK